MSRVSQAVGISIYILGSTTTVSWVGDVIWTVSGWPHVGNCRSGTPTPTKLPGSLSSREISRTSDVVRRFLLFTLRKRRQVLRTTRNHANSNGMLAAALDGPSKRSPSYEASGSNMTPSLWRQSIHSPCVFACDSNFSACSVHQGQHLISQHHKSAHCSCWPPLRL
ncbi:hypothetical protein DE146DRAFT_659480 [Phaeosphaeria sp. MPI-PUGE-AT-0046c]|nr:hypothetical protein DE146DRAFT_659480 [Phaeosphaeria sp. MPI-PUGE-AT-0046c]